ncbi:MAG TPA: hypothetical protein VLK33_13245 [Terriglobales bacterium]|nr:hypothetical protein [Terriglobales bacterium]
MVKRLGAAMAIGLLISALPWFLQNYTVLAPLQLLMIPGAFIAVALAGNVHAYSLTVVVFANMVLYALPVYFFLRHREKARTRP